MKYYQDSEAKSAIDELLEKNAINQANLGTESADEERYRVQSIWKDYLLPKIREIDPEFAEVVQAN